MNDTKPRNRIRPTSAEAKLAADQADKALNHLGAKLTVAYFALCVVSALCISLAAAYFTI